MESPVNRAMLLEALQARIGHTFRDPTLLDLALTHSTWANEHGDADNERLEFLGDAVLYLAVSEHLYHRYPDLPEGRLTQMRKHLVEGKAHSFAADTWGLAPLLRLGRGEQMRPTVNPTILARAFEALLGALVRDGGYATCQTLLAPWVEERLEALEGTPVVDAKTRLQEWHQARYKAPPVYEVVQVTGPPHCPEYTVTVWVHGEQLGAGVGRKKQEAEQAAAVEAITALGSAGLWAGLADSPGAGQPVDTASETP